MFLSNSVDMMKNLHTAFRSYRKDNEVDSELISSSFFRFRHHRIMKLFCVCLVFPPGQIQPDWAMLQNPSTLAAFIHEVKNSLERGLDLQSSNDQLCNLAIYRIELQMPTNSEPFPLLISTSFLRFPFRQ